MIPLTDTKVQKNSSLPIDLKVSDKKPLLDFAQLLKGLENTDKKDIKTGINSLILSLGVVGEKNNSHLKVKKNISLTSQQKPQNTKKESLELLLKGDEPKVEEIPKERVDLNTKLQDLIAPKDMKMLVKNAKEYLKEQITQTPQYKQQQIKEMPKTLKGLLSLADKVGVEVEKITLQEVMPKTKELLNSKEIPNNTDTKTKSPQPLLSTKDILLFKPQNTENMAQQLVSNKDIKQKAHKNRSDESLKQLLQGEKTIRSEKLTSEFSVESAKVIAPKLKDDDKRELASLLGGDIKDKKTDKKADGVGVQKTDIVSAHKVDSLEVKINEAKQMVKYLSHDVKSAIDDYKAPFTRVKLQLNPKHFGEIELTVVQRGKNLHLNLSSNTTAINTLSMNAGELKTQLSNNGINNATLNFSSNSQNSEQQNSQRQNQQNGKKAQREYGYMMDEGEDILTSLEIIVPRYI